MRPRQRYRNESIAEYERDSMFETSLSIESKADSQTTGEQSLKENLPFLRNEKKTKSEFLRNNRKVLLTCTCILTLIIISSSLVSAFLSRSNPDVDIEESGGEIVRESFLPRNETKGPVVASLKYSQLQSYQIQTLDTAAPAEETELLLIGGESEARELSRRVEVYNRREYSHCLPDLPRSIKWGVGGLVGSSLVVCGGEMANQQPVSSCHLLSNSRLWTKYQPLHSPRSQSSYANTNNSRLVIFGGYNRNYPGLVIPSMETVSVQGDNQVENVTSSSHVASGFSSAVALSDGSLVITGGVGREHQVTLLTQGETLQTEALSPMREGRYRHSSVVILQDSLEVIIVAGGTSSVSRMIGSVERFSRRDNTWTFLQPLPTPRIDFTLQVKSLFCNDRQNLIDF